MISKDQVKNLISQKGVTEKNRYKVESLLSKINSISDKEWENLVSQKRVTEENLILIIEKIMETNEFTPINDLISYGITENTLHIHIVPNDVRNLMKGQRLQLANQKLIEALAYIRQILKDGNSNNIKLISAISPVLKLRIVQDMFKKLEFTVSETDAEYLLSKFPEAKAVYKAELPVEQLLSREYGYKLDVENQTR